MTTSGIRELLIDFRLLAIVIDFIGFLVFEQSLQKRFPVRGEYKTLIN